MTEQATKDKGKKEGRSPGYPAIDLEDALEKRAKIVMEKEKRHYASLITLFGHWGYGPKSSQAMLVFAALKKYGLMESKGTGASREGRITDLAWRILVDDRPNSHDRKALIQEAALSPPIYHKLWSDYDGQLPSDENLKHRLITVEGFTRGAVDDFIRNFRATISFAKLEESDSLSGHEEDKPELREESIMSPALETKRLEQPSMPIPQSGSSGLPPQEFKLALSEGEFAYIRVPHSLRATDWEKIEGLLKILKPSDA